MNRFQAEATTIVGLAVLAGVTVALVFGKIGLDAWLAVSAFCGVMIGLPQRAPTPSPVPTPVAPAADAVPAPAVPASQETPR